MVDESSSEGTSGLGRGVRSGLGRSGRWKGRVSGCGHRRGRMAFFATVVVMVAVMMVALAGTRVDAFEAAIKTTGRTATTSPPAAAQTASVSDTTTTAKPTVSESKPTASPSADAATTTTTTPPLDKLIIEIQHLLDADSLDAWAPRQTLEVLFATGQQRSGMTYSNYSFSDADMTVLQTLAAQNDLYRLRFRVTNLPVASAWIVASVRACALLQSALVESHVFHLDIFGQLLAVTYSVPSNSCSAKKTNLKSFAVRARSKLSFGRSAERVMQIRMRAAPVASPDGAGSGSGQKPAEEQSFVAKYWMYLLPAAVFLFLNMAAGAMEEQKEANAAAASSSSQGSRR